MRLLYNILHRTSINIPRYGYNFLKNPIYRNFSTNNVYVQKTLQNVNFCRINVTFVQYDQEINVTVPVGISILEAAHKNNIDIEGACDGSMACSTCHVILEEEVYDSLPEPSETELDMLDLAPCLTPTSRLGCQIILTEEHEGIRIQLPKMTRNFYVDGYTPTPH